MPAKPTSRYPARFLFNGIWMRGRHRIIGGEAKQPWFFGGKIQGRKRPKRKR